jgi:hypothetical protein
MNRMRPARFLIAFLLAVAGLGGASAQTRDQAAPAQPGTTCPPETNSGPTVGRAPELSDKLAESKGVICPPAGVDPDIRVQPPAGGELKVIPPPGTPGGDPSVQPK